MHDFHGATQREGPLFTRAHRLHRVTLRVVAVYGRARSAAALPARDVDLPLQGGHGETPRAGRGKAERSPPLACDWIKGADGVKVFGRHSVAHHGVLLFGVPGGVADVAAEDVNEVPDAGRVLTRGRQPLNGSHLTPLLGVDIKLLHKMDRGAVFVKATEDEDFFVEVGDGGPADRVEHARAHLELVLALLVGDVHSGLQTLGLVQPAHHVELGAHHHAAVQVARDAHRVSAHVPQGREDGHGLELVHDVHRPALV